MSYAKVEEFQNLWKTFVTEILMPVKQKEKESLKSKVDELMDNFLLINKKHYHEFETEMSRLHEKLKIINDGETQSET